MRLGFKRDNHCGVDLTYYYETRDNRMVKVTEQEFNELLTFVKTYNESYVVKNDYYLGKLVTKWLMYLSE